MTKFHTVSVAIDTGMTTDIPTYRAIFENPGEMQIMEKMMMAMVTLMTHGWVLVIMITTQWTGMAMVLMLRIDCRSNQQ